MKEDNLVERSIESKEDVLSYLDKLKYALGNTQYKVRVQQDRHSDIGRPMRFTNRYTIADLFPDEEPSCAVKRELDCLRVEEYIETVKDDTFTKRSDLRVFGRKYDKGDVYIKIRVELLQNHVLVLSFHYAEKHLRSEDFPYA